MVSSAVLGAIGFTIFVSMVFPILASVGLCATKRLHWKPLLTGMTMFCIAQIFIRMPVLNLLSQQGWYQAMLENPWLSGLFLAVTAALVEEWARYFGSRFFVRDMTSSRDAVSYGIGHGGVESVALVGMNNINNFLLCLAINQGTISRLIPSVGEGQVQSIIQGLTTTPALEFAAVGIERLMTMIIQVALSLLVYYGIRKKKTSFVWLAVLAHVAVNTPLLGLVSLGGIWAGEAYLLACTVAAVILIRKIIPAFSVPPADEMK